MATRFYPTVKAPNVLVHGPCRGTWGVKSVFNRAWSPVQWQWRMGTSKTDGGTYTSHLINTNQQGDFDFHFLNFWTAPLQAQTISGTFDLCFLVAQRWMDDLDPPADISVVRWKVHIYIAVGQTTVVRHTLLNNYVDTQDFPFSTLEGLSLASAQSLTAGNALDGDTVRVEIGFRVVSSPTPDATQPPVNMTEIRCKGTGTNAATGDVTAGSTDQTLNSWMEFSHNFSFAAASSAPANDACADAVNAGSADPYVSDWVDTTASADTERAVWWRWTAPATGKAIIHTFGSNYGTVIAVFEGGCGLLNSPAGIERIRTSLSQHRSQSSLVFDAVQSTEYHIRISNTASTFNATNSGGLCRMGVFMRQTPEVDDLFLPAQNVLQLREGVPVSLTGAFVGSDPSGIALDYTGTSMEDLNGGNHTSHRVLLALFGFDLIEILDANTLSYGSGQSEIDFISLPWDTLPLEKHPATLYVTAAGQLFVAWFGTGFEYVAGIGSLPAFLNTVSDDPENGHIRQIAATAGDTQSTGPFDDTVHPATAETTAPWAITMDEENGIIYFTSGSFYGFVGGTEVRTYNIATQATETFAIIVPRPGNSAGVKGLQFIPGGGLLVCNGDVVHRLDSSGTIVGTYTPSVPEDSQELVDVKLTADGTGFWCVDLATVRLFKVDLATMEEEATYETYLEPGTLTQMAIYQPEGIEPPVEPPVEPPEEEEPECPDDLIDPPPASPLAKFFKVHGPPATSAASVALADAEFTDLGGALGDTAFGALPLGASGIRRRPGLGFGV